MDNTIDKDLDMTIDILDAAESDDASDFTVDEAIDDVSDAINDVKYGDSDEDDDAIECMEGIALEDIEVEAEDEHDAAEIELMNEDMDNDPDVADDDIIELAAELEDEEEVEMEEY